MLCEGEKKGKAIKSVAAAASPLIAAGNGSALCSLGELCVAAHEAVFHLLQISDQLISKAEGLLLKVQSVVAVDLMYIQPCEEIPSG